MIRLPLVLATGVVLAWTTAEASAHPPAVIIHPTVPPFGPPRVLPVVPVVPGPIVYPPVSPVLPSPVLPPVVRPGVGRDFVVYIRPAPLAPWTVYGRYDTRLEATRVARWLEASGYLTRIDSVPGW
ncbi:MAG: hypothetical protein KatS3mg107_1220 [Gemmataceae bacterium]|jgi:hypothetical protein|nr:MAG: hypothetical protein KatS3mg107_1220 [Gemmataceae bacterium]